MVGEVKRGHTIRPLGRRLIRISKFWGGWMLVRAQRAVALLDWVDLHREEIGLAG